LSTPKQATVLIVDDIPENIALLLNTLRDAEFHVLVAESGKSALERLKYVIPDVILLDVAMPGLNGFQTCLRIKRNPATAQIPILFLTAHDEVINKVHGFQIGGVDYITKPIEVEEVLVRIETHITLNRLQREIKSQNKTLEVRVQERTAELEEEIERRKEHEAGRQKLLDILSHQSDQLSSMTQWLIDSQQERHEKTFTTLYVGMTDELSQIIAQLQSHQSALESYPENNLDFSMLETTELKDALTSLILLQARLESTLPPSTLLSEEEREILEGPLLKLSAREREVLQLVANGKSYTEIAELFNISPTTVRSHRSRIMQKLGLRDSSDLMKFAIRHNLTDL